jgi:UDP-N-acetylmuramoylalanine--D-glutamate ligase
LGVEGKPVVVVGLARSGVAAALFLVSRGETVVATDRKGEGELQEEVVKLKAAGVTLELGGHDADTFVRASKIVVSPGVPWALPELETARRAGVPVVAEIELAYEHLQGTVAAVTGTKGKSTTTAALGAMLKEAGHDARVGGNIGEALTALVPGSTEKTVFAVEVSSFQLEGIDTFRPRVAVFLNLSADHLDRHSTFEDYKRAKGRVFENQTAEDFAVVNAEDPLVLVIARAARGRVVPFYPSSIPSGEGAFFEGGFARLRFSGAEETLFARGEAALPGDHLAGDLLAAATAARLLGAPPSAIARAVRAFRGVEHVLEHVATLDGVAFYNDTKATNVEAARRSLEAFSRPVLVIMGGRYKGGDFADLAHALRDHGKAVLAIGEAQERIARSLSAVVPVERCPTLRSAVERAWELASAGDVVLLAPACSSFDMFRDYAERGRQFKEEVRRLTLRLDDDGRPPKAPTARTLEDG